MESSKELVTVVSSHLTHREEAALRAHKAAREPDLGPQLSAQLFELYLRGATLEEIARVNSPSIRLGAIVSAWRNNDWHGRREAYRQGLYESVQHRVSQTQAEGLVFLADYLAVFSKRFGQGMKRYLQTGDDSELGDMKPSNLAQMKMAFELMLKVAGLDQTKKIVGKVEHTHTAGAQEDSEGTTITTEQAMAFLLSAK